MSPEHAEYLRAAIRAGLRRTRQNGLTPAQITTLIHCTPEQLQWWEDGHGPYAMAATVYELLMLKTGLFTLDRIVWARQENGGRLYLRLPDAYLVPMRVSSQTLSSLTRLRGTALSTCSQCQRHYLGPECPACSPPPTGRPQPSWRV